MTPGHADRECPLCGHERVCSVRDAHQVFRVSEWQVAESMFEDADRVCSLCKAVRIDGTWDRAQSVDSRAWELAQASDSKTADEYREILTAGPREPGGAPADRGADDSGELEW